MARIQLAILCVAASTFWAFGLTGCGTESSPEPGRYYDQGKGFSIRFPVGWSIQEENEGATIAALCPEEDADDMFFECVSVTVEDLPYRMSLNEFFDGNRKSINTYFSDVVVKETGTATIDNAPAKWISYTYEMQEGSVQALEYCLLEARRGYYITCDSEPHKFAAYRDTLEESAQSFRFE